MLFKVKLDKGVEVRSRSSGRRYELVERLGEGSNGEVWLAVTTNNDTRSYVAAKFVEVEKGRKKVLLREVLNQRLHRCHNLVLLYEAFGFKQYLCIIMEYVPGGTLREFIRERGPISEDLARFYYQQINFASVYLHTNGVVMRDIKLNNMLLNEKKTVLKLCDYGASKSDGAPCTLVGTPAYVAPELVRAFRESRSMEIPPYDGRAVDVWCGGVCLYIMLYGKYPFEEGQEVYNSIIECKPDIAEHQQRRSGTTVEVSSDARDLLARIFVSNPNERITIEEICRLPWFLKDLPEGAKEQLAEFSKPFDPDAVIQTHNLQPSSVLEQTIFPDTVVEGVSS